MHLSGQTPTCFWNCLGPPKPESSPVLRSCKDAEEKEFPAWGPGLRKSPPAPSAGFALSLGSRGTLFPQLCDRADGSRLHILGADCPGAGDHLQLSLRDCPGTPPASLSEPRKLCGRRIHRGVWLCCLSFLSSWLNGQCPQREASAFSSLHTVCIA